MAQAWKSINGFIVSLTSSFDQLKLWFYTEIKKKPEKTSLKTVNHHREGIFTSFKLELSASTEVVQCMEALTFSFNWF